MTDPASSLGSSAESRPPLSTRFAAALIDGLVASLLGGIPILGVLIGTGYLVVRDGMKVGALKYRSVGKYVMGLNVVRLEGGTMDIEVSVQRNWMFGVGLLGAGMVLIPFIGRALASLFSLAAFGLVAYEIYNILADAAGRRWGDRIGNTKVVEAGDGLI